MLVTGGELIRVEPDGGRVRHADLNPTPYGWSEITVDGRGNIYVGSINFDRADFNDLIAGGDAPGKIALVTPDGEARRPGPDHVAGLGRSSDPRRSADTTRWRRP